MVPAILLLLKGSNIYVLKRTEIYIFVHYLFKTWIAHLTFKIDYSNFLSLLY